MSKTDLAVGVQERETPQSFSEGFLNQFEQAGVTVRDFPVTPYEIKGEDGGFRKEIAFKKLFSNLAERRQRLGWGLLEGEAEDASKAINSEMLVIFRKIQMISEDFVIWDFVPATTELSDGKNKMGNYIAKLFLEQAKDKPREKWACRIPAALLGTEGDWLVLGKKDPQLVAKDRQAKEAQETEALSSLIRPILEKIGLGPSDTGEFQLGYWGDRELERGDTRLQAKTTRELVPLEIDYNQVFIETIASRWTTDDVVRLEVSRSLGAKDSHYGRYGTEVGIVTYWKRMFDHPLLEKAVVTIQADGDKEPDLVLVTDGTGNVSTVDMDRDLAQRMYYWVDILGGKLDQAQGVKKVRMFGHPEDEVGFTVDFEQMRPDIRARWERGIKEATGVDITGQLDIAASLKQCFVRPDSGKTTKGAYAPPLVKVS